MTNPLKRGFLIGGIIFVLTSLLYLLGVFKTWEWKTWDWRLQAFASPSHASPDIILILIDQKSLDVYADEQGLSWPWPREMYSYLLEYCHRAGARAVGFDLIFSETSSWGEADDQVFAQTMHNTGIAFLPVFFSSQEQSHEQGLSAALADHTIKKVPFRIKNLIPMQSVTVPLDVYIFSAQGLGNVNFSPDKDSIYRRLPLVIEYQNKIFPSFPWEISSFIRKENPLTAVPVDKKGNMIIKYHGPTDVYTLYSAAAVINSFAQMEAGRQPQIPLNEFKDKIVLIGGSAPGLLDLRPTPFSPVAPGVGIQAAAIDNLLNQDFIRISGVGILLLFIAFISILAGVLTSVLPRVIHIIFFAAGIFLLPAVLACGAYFLGYWFEFVAPEFAVLVTFTAAIVVNYNVEGKKKRFIKNVFQYYLSPHVIEHIIEDPSKLRLGGERKEISSFFSDLAGFTTISESLSPEDLVHLLNAYLSEMTDIILETGGTLDKYEGDAIIAFWNAPVDQPDHALRAARAAVQCQKKLAEIREAIKAKFGHELYMRIGINSGQAVVGNMGAKNRFDYTAMGDTVNLASRLEGACKQYDVPILMGEMTYEHIKDVFAAREIDLIRVIGKKKPVHVYEPMGEIAAVPTDKLKAIEVFHEGLKAYRKRDWNSALDLFISLGDDKLAKVYVDRINMLIKEPPPIDWAGVFDLKSK
jgi:adenylate cyclase